MDLQTILSTQGPALLARLQGAGLSAEQARDFLPAAADQVSQSAASGGIASLLGGGGGIEDIINNVDIGALAERVGIDKALADKALQSIIPTVLEALQGGAGAAGMIGGLAGKLLR